MAIALAPSLGVGAQFFTDDGVPLAGGYLYTYTAGTTTPAGTYTSYSGGTPNANPIILDAAGRIPYEVWLTVGSSYKFVLKDASLTQIWEKDYISVYSPTSALVDLANSSNVALGDALVAFKQSNGSGALTGATARTVHTKLQEYVSVKDFGATGDGSTDDSAAFILAIKNGRRVYVPAGTYLMKAMPQISTKSDFELIGDGIGLSVIKAHIDLGANDLFQFLTCDHFRVSGITFDGDDLATFTTYSKVGINISVCENFCFDHCEFIKLPYMAVYGASMLYFRFQDNIFSRTSATGSYTNYNLNVDRGTGVPYTAYGTIIGNQSYNSQCNVRGNFITVANNLFYGSKYGSGLTLGDTGTAGTCGNYMVIGNVSAANTGLDVDSVNVCGMEVFGYYNTIANNICLQNGGAGLALGGRRNIVTGNACLGNGVNGNAGSYSGSDQAGIKAFQDPVDTTNGASYSLISGNICADLGAGKQKYGYFEETAQITGMMVHGNHFALNDTRPVYILSSEGYYNTQEWSAQTGGSAWTPSVASIGGTLTSSTVNTKLMRLDSKIVHFNLNITVTNIGSGTGGLKIGLPTSPVAATAERPAAAYGINVTTNRALSCYVDSATGLLMVYHYDGSTFPVANNDVIQLNGYYEAYTS